MKTIILILFFGFSLNFLNAQYPDNCFTKLSEEETTKLKDAFVRLHDVIKIDAEPEQIHIESYKKARKDLIYMIRTCPKIHKSIYQKGVHLYKILAQVEKDSLQKIIYQDSVLTLYDLRVEYFGEKAKVSNEKAYVAYYYLYDKPSRYGALQEMYQETWKLNKENIYPQNLQFWFQVMAFMKANNATGFYDKYKEDWQSDIITPLFEEVMFIIEEKINTNKDEAQEWIEARTSIETSFRALVPYTCEYVYKYLLPKYRENPDSVALLKEMIKIMAIATQDTTEESGNCVKGDTLFLELAERLYELEPEPYGKPRPPIWVRDSAKREYYRNKALELATTGEQKASIYMELAGEARKAGNYPQARQYYKLAAQNNLTLAGKCYTIIGDMYLASGSSCGGANPIEKRAYAIAAYNIYVKAKNTARQTRAKQYFPSQEMYKQYPEMQGKSYILTCWIGETVIFPKL